MKQQECHCHHQMILGLAAIVLLFTLFSVKGACQFSSSVLLLVADSTSLAPSELNLQLVAHFYGLKVNVKSVSSVDSSVLLDDSGHPFRCVETSAFLLENLDTSSDNMLLAYVNNGGNIFVQDLSNDSRQGTHTNLYRLTGGKVTGVQRQGQTHADLFFSSSAPTITDVFTGLSFVSIYPRHDQALLLSADTSAKPLLGRHNSAGDYFCFFAECSAGSGSVFVSSANDTMAWIYLNEAYNVRFAPTVLPAMMTLRYLYGDKAWHISHRFANLTIDDPALANVQLNYPSLLSNVEQHGFHLTIAYIPLNFISKKDDPAVEQLFVSNPQYLSIVQHGDCHHADNDVEDGYEFFVYTSADSALECATENLCGFYPVPLARQEVKIVDGATKIYVMEKELGLPQNRGMIFPDGIAPLPTLSLLRKYNFHASVNGETVPLLSYQDTSWDSWMRPADLSYGSMPLLGRGHPYNRDSLQTGPFFSFGVFDLFIGVPALYYSHPYELFVQSSSAFNNFADSINALTDPPAWVSLDSIATDLYLLKTNDDGSDSLWAFGNVIYLESTTDMMMHIMKQVSGGVNPIQAFVNGTPEPSLYNNGYRYLDVLVHEGTTKVEFLYQHNSVDFSLGADLVPLSGDSVAVWVRNNGDSSGVCPVIVFDSTSKGLLSVSTQWVNAHDSTLYFFPSPALPHDANWIILDPGGIVQEQSASSVRSSILITGISGGGHSNDPDRYTLSQNYPNPFNPSTTIQFDLKEESSVRLQVYNILGQKVTELSFGRMRAGSYNRQLDMSRYTSGIYFYRLDAVGIDGQRFLSSKKMLLLK